MHVTNKSNASLISLTFSPPGLAAAIGHVHKLSDYSYEELNSIENMPQYVWSMDAGIYQPENVQSSNLTKKESADQTAETLEDPAENLPENAENNTPPEIAVESESDAEAANNVLPDEIVVESESDAEAANEVLPDEIAPESESDTEAANEVLPDAQPKLQTYMRQIEFDTRSWSALKFDIFRLAPSSLYIYANFADETFVHGTQKRLIAVFDTSTAYDHNERRNLEHLLIPIYNKKPMIAHINSDTIRHMHFTLETSDGNPYPFLTSDFNNTCKLNLSFRFK